MSEEDVNIGLIVHLNRRSVNHTCVCLFPSLLYVSLRCFKNTVGYTCTDDEDNKWLDSTLLWERLLDEEHKKYSYP